MKKREFETVPVSKRAEKTIAAGHPWVYDSEAEDAGCAAEDGERLLAVTIEKEE